MSTAASCVCGSGSCRCETLQGERDEAREMLAAMTTVCGEYLESSAANYDRAEAAERQLAKARAQAADYSMYCGDWKAIAETAQLELAQAQQELCVIARLCESGTGAGLIWYESCARQCALIARAALEGEKT